MLILWLIILTIAVIGQEVRLWFISRSIDATIGFMRSTNETFRLQMEGMKILQEEINRAARF